jgi:hypothetical protein
MTPNPHIVQVFDKFLALNGPNKPGWYLTDDKREAHIFRTAKEACYILNKITIMRPEDY